MATRALKISGNKGVDAALETIQKLGHQEGRNGFARAATTGQLQRGHSHYYLDNHVHIAITTHRPQTKFGAR